MYWIRDFSSKTLSLPTFWEVAFFLSLLFSFLFSIQSWGSACCARNSAAPFLIVGDDEAQMSLGVSSSGRVASVDLQGRPTFGTPETSDFTQMFRLDGALLLSDRFQLGCSFPYLNRQVTRSGVTESVSGVGDLRISMGYEFLPVWSYSQWKPQGFLFSVISVPTGVSVHESRKKTVADAVGNGFYSISVGSLFLKKWVIWDLFLVPEVHYSFRRTFQRSNQFYQMIPGWGGSVGFGVGWSPGGGNWRIGTRIQPRWDQSPVSAADYDSSLVHWRASCDTGVDISYLLDSSNTVMFFYTDQTLLAPAFNSTLNRMAGINFQHRWER